MDNIRSLVQIVTLADTGNYRRAAKKLGVTHSALSQTVSKLEQDLDAPLFVRNRHETIPTAFGSRLIESARSVIGELGEAERDISLMRNLEAGRLIIGADPVVSEGLLGPSIAKMLELYPKLKFTVISRDYSSMEEDLLAKRIDVYVGISPDRQRDDISYRKIPLAPPVFACRSSHPLAELSCVTMDQLVDWPVVGAGAPDWVMEKISQTYPKQFPTIRSAKSVFLVSNSLGLLKRLILSTDAVGLVPRHVIQGRVKYGQAAILNVDKLPFNEPVHGVIATLEHRPVSPAATELTKQIFVTIREAIATTQQSAAT